MGRSQTTAASVEDKFKHIEKRRKINEQSVQGNNTLDLEVLVPGARLFVAKPRSRKNRRNNPTGGITTTQREQWRENCDRRPFYGGLFCKIDAVDTRRNKAALPASSEENKLANASALSSKFSNELTWSCKRKCLRQVPLLCT